MENSTAAATEGAMRKDADYIGHYGVPLSGNASSDVSSAAFDPVNVFMLLPLVVLLMVVTVAANAVVMVCVRIDKRLASTMSSVYVFSMAAADEIIGLFVMGGMAVYTVYGYWPLGHIWCTVWVVLDFVSCSISVINLCLIAYDRFEAVVHPIDYRQKRNIQNAVYRALGAWLAGVLLWLPATIVFRVLDPGPILDCFYVPAPAYVVVMATAHYGGLFFLMTIFYIGCLKRLRTRYIKTVAEGADKGLKLFFTGEGGGVSTDAAAGQAGKEGPAAAAAPAAPPVISQFQLQKQQRQLRSIRTLGVVMVVFLICWLPWVFSWAIAAYCPVCIPDWMFEYSYWAAYINSTINPLLYFLSNRDFRTAFMGMIGRPVKEEKE